MMSRVRRWRKCPSCDVVLPASKFKTIGRHRPGYSYRQRARRCPNCWHSGATWVFKVVRDSSRKVWE